MNTYGPRISFRFSRQAALKLIAFVGFALASGAFRRVQADSIPYPNPGTYNSVTYSFTAAASGDVVAYFAGSSAGFDNQVGLLVNGVQQGGFGLDDKTSAIMTLDEAAGALGVSLRTANRHWAFARAWLAAALAPD